MAVEIVMPRLSDSMEEGTIVKWFVAAGDTVGEGQPLVEVETDKASVTYECEQDGTILALAARAGESVPVGGVIAVLGAAGEEVVAAAVAAAGPTAAPAAGASPVTSPAAAPDRVRASPLARRIAAQLGVDLGALVGSGPYGRVVRADVERSRPAGNGAEVEVGSADAARPDAGDERPVREAGSKGEATEVPLTRRQQTVARRMAESRATVPDFELRSEIDMSRAVALREQMREVSERPPSYNDLIVKAAALALREFPRVNGAWRDGTLEQYGRVNVGIAVAADDALLVPTIFDADVKSLAEIAAASRTLAARVRDGSIAPAELSGGTFSISNLGMFGLDSFSAVINAPQAAILAVGALKSRPVVDESDPGNPVIVARPTIHVTLACDHRVLYGADGARFLARLRELLERPMSLLL